MRTIGIVEVSDTLSSELKMLLLIVTDWNMSCPSDKGGLGSRGCHHGVDTYR